MQSSTGKKILEARKALKISQAALASAMGSSRPTISNWENGRFEPELASINKLAAALKRPVTYFFDKTQVSQVAESPAGYSASDNAVRLPMLTHIPEDIAQINEGHVEGYIELPRFIAKGARYVLAVSPGMRAYARPGSYLLVRPETNNIAGKTMLAIAKGGKPVVSSKKQLSRGSIIVGQVVKVLQNVD